MIREAIDRILEINKPTIINDSGKRYATGELIELKSPEQLPVPLQFHTLVGFVEYITHERFDNTLPRQLAAIVDGPESVRLVSELFGEFNQRQTLVECKRFQAQGFPFGQYLDPEIFIVQMQSKFVPDDVTAAILRIVGNLESVQAQTVVDDGVSQQVTAKAGVARVANVVLPNPVGLRPFRTFQEIEQPSSAFVLRVQRGVDGQLPKIALHEVEDCNWKIAAVDDISDYLRNNCAKGFPIFA